MTKYDLLDTLRKETGLSKSKSEHVVELFFDEMSNALVRSDRVKIRSLCSIYIKDYKGYTGERVQVLAKKLPVKELKDTVDYK